MNNDLKVGDFVKIPFESAGVLKKIKTLVWGFNYIVEITQSNFGFYELWQEEAFKLEQLEKIEI